MASRADHHKLTVTNRFNLPFRVGLIIIRNNVYKCLGEDLDYDTSSVNSSYHDQQALTEHLTERSVMVDWELNPTVRYKIFTRCLY